MRTTVFVGLSLDGFIARADGGLDWLPTDGGGDTGYEAFFASVDVLVMGRNTFETVVGFPQWPYGDKPVVVLTHRPLDAHRAKGGRVEAMAGTPADVHARLAARGFQHAYVDGAATAQAFLRAGLVDRLVLTYVPVLIGQGIALFGALDRDVRLRHAGTRTLKGGLVQSEYQVER